MTEPLVPSDTDLRDFHFMPLDVARLMNSDLVAVASGEEFRAAVLLWCKSWHQVPAASLPSDDRMLAHLAGFGRDLKAWGEVKEMALRGFIACTDGRLYHPVIAEKAIEAIEAKRKQRIRTAAATAARKSRPNDCDGHRNDQRDDERNDARNVVQETGTVDIGETSPREASAALESKLREAAGWQRETAPSLFVTGPIEALIANGADLESDVLPVIRGLAPKVRRPSSWNYFVGAIQDAVAARTAAATGPPASQPVAFSRNIGRPQNGTRNTIAAGFELIDQAIAERERQLADAQGGQGCREGDPLALPRLREGTA